MTAFAFWLGVVMGAGLLWFFQTLRRELSRDRVPHLITCHCAHCLNELYQRTGQ